MKEIEPRTNSSTQKLVLFVMMILFIFGALFAVLSVSTKKVKASKDLIKHPPTTGKDIHNMYCISCHRSMARHPRYSTPEQWNNVITLMETFKGADFSSMSIDQRKKLILYLVENRLN